MLAPDQAAKYLVVAWVKDWTMRTLLETLDGAKGDITQSRVDAVAAALTFMPSHRHWYLGNKGYGISARHFISDSFPRLSEALWAAKDHAKRLSFAPQIMRLNAGNATASSRFSKQDLAEDRKTESLLRQADTSYRASRDAFKTHKRSAWNVCK